MRILLITETVPYPLDSGGRIKTWHTLDALAREHEVHCHAFVRNERQRDAAAAPLGRICASLTLHLVPRSLPREAVHLARSLSLRLPLTIVRHYSRRVMPRVAAECRERRIELLYCDHLSMLEYGRRLTLPIVHDAHNVEHRIVQRYAEGLPRTDVKRLLFEREGRRLRAYEASMYPKCSLIFAVSEVDAAAIASFAPQVPVVPVPIAVAAATLTPIERVTEAPEVLFVGAQDWPPNADAVDYFLREIWPRVRSQVPDARLTIVGRGEAAVKARWGSNPSLRFTGWVQDVDPWFRQSRVMVVPLRSGSGMRVKILDAFARGLPVVATSIGMEGIAAGGEQALIADTPDAFASATVRILQDRALAERLSKAARALAVELYDTRTVGERQLDALRRLAEHGGGAPGHRSGRG
jgi:polysaccharide biosynthesis protein PslH